MTETVVAAGPQRGHGGTKCATAQAIASAIPGPPSAGQGKLQGPSGHPGRHPGQPLGVSAALAGSASALSASRRHTTSSTKATEATACSTETAAERVVSSAAGSAAARLAKTRLPISTLPSPSPSVSTSTAQRSSLPSPLLHRRPRSYLQPRTCLAASNLDRASRPPSQPSAAAAAAATAHRARRASDDSAVSLGDHSSSPPLGSSPPSSVGQDIQAPSPYTPVFCASPPRSRWHRQRASSFDLPPTARPRPRAYSDQGPRPDVSRPPQAFNLRRSSNPEPPVGSDSRLSPASSHSSLRSRSARQPASFSAKGISTLSGPPPSINGRLLQVAGDDANFAALQQQQQHQHHYQPRLISGTRQLLPLKTAAKSSTPDEPRRRSLQTQSYRLSLTGSLPTNATPIRVPPIRSFRSSGSRRSLNSPDMNFTPRPYDLNESAGAPLYDEDLARTAAGPDALYDRQSRLMTPPVSSHQGVTGEDSGDVFLRLAREEAVNRTTNGRTPDGTYSPVSATHRSWHRRPLSTNLASYQPISPPKLRRRLSDQQERPNLSSLEDDQTSQASRVLQYRPMSREKAASAHPGEFASQFAPSTRTHRPPPLSSRSTVYHDNSDSYRHGRRRSSVTESTPPISGRGQSYKTGPVYNYSKTYNSSPLIRSFDLPPPQPQEHQNGVDGTESTASTTAPSTVWDELDELKWRLSRLETVKPPSTSGAAVTKMPEERPVTANTIATTASMSPKRQVHVHAEETDSVSTQKDVFPNLQNALANCRQNLSPAIFQALDYVAQDALGLSTAMSQAPMPSGAGAVADRQLRRKAESVCQSLTELCITLNDDAAYRAGTSQQQAQSAVPGTPSTPTLPKSHSSGLPVSRRSSVVESNIPLSHTSPRVISRFEERRNSLLHGSGPPVSLHSNPNAPMLNENGLGRHSSLLVSRTRQSRQEELEDGRESVLSRNRRAMTEEPDDGRRSTFFVRSRRGTAEDMDQPLSRSPTRRTMTMAYQRANENAIEMDGPDRQDTSSVVSSAAGSRRRFVSELHASRLAGPSGFSPATPTRKYLERAVPTREGAGTPSSMDHRLSRHVSMHNRAGSQPRTNRDSMLPRPPSGNVVSEGSQ
ncbi:uncharacterized protein LMH87_008532 [Akanthomyces muscarius]|uniref:Cell wall anchor protein n=1 Tax=Akanthomyces muscarius TaxID=2231603 RepID=A0A9W8UM21_AKAMU|nr:uncharacterized protein LMH87_008532 [Akanthomyces muscarius]KAJ4157985.1 hypothetical protein LMH87_008532 [Akanthomyces muscarius]